MNFAASRASASWRATLAIAGAATLCGVHACGLGAGGPDAPRRVATRIVHDDAPRDHDASPRADVLAVPEGGRADEQDASAADGGASRERGAERSEPSPTYRVTRSVAPSTKSTRPSFARCVLHSGSARRSGRRVKLVDGGVRNLPPTDLACAFDAECIRHDTSARAAGGDDGFASLQCDGRECVCSLERLRDQGPSPDGRTERYEESFELAEGCGDADLARRLLEEICMRGMPRATNSKLP